MSSSTIVCHLNIYSLNENSIKLEQFGLFPGKEKPKYNGKLE